MECEPRTKGLTCRHQVVFSFANAGQLIRRTACAAKDRRSIKEPRFGWKWKLLSHYIYIYIFFFLRCLGIVE